MRDGTNFDDIENLWVRNGTSITKNPLRELIQDLDSLPFPSYANDSYYFINDDKFDHIDHAIEDRHLWIQGSRGCPFVCTYCVNSVTQPLFKDNGKYRRVRSVGNVVEEIKYQLRVVEQVKLPKNSKNTVLFIDEVFGNDKEWMSEFESVYPKEVGLPYLMETLPHPNLVNETTLNLFVNSGVEEINFGIQTGSDYIRNRIFRRPTKNKEIIEIANDIAKRGVTLRYDLIADNPYDTEETLKETVELLLQLPLPLSFNLFRLQWFPDYPLTKLAIKDGYITEEDASIESLIKTTTNDWAYVPKLMLTDKKIRITNVIWLIVWGHTKYDIVRFSVFNDSIGSKLCLYYLNLKAVLYGKVVGVGGLRKRYRLIARGMTAIALISKGNFKELIRQVTWVIKKKIRRSRFQYSQGAYSGYHKMTD